ncbi:MAG TPA: proteasome-type protease [Aromatoleum sp.]|uniref:proteasome-type protease n=1 Tax=Aromatoleum sp. TaxID=2307007 RepID=UPI002B489374|nr:proteasome-type protease [Aromatoleum sp.]HJV26621.1 proteasome-type protease [Aromatoleum sp.]
MTYCVAMRLDAGLVFLSDSRTYAGVDHINTFRKMHFFERPGDRVLVLMTAGNLSISQSVVNTLRERIECNDKGRNLWKVPSMFEAAKHVGDCLREVHARDAESMKEFGVDFSAGLLLGGQIRGEEPRLFQIYAAGNFTEATKETPYFQIGESKYGKPIIVRVITHRTSLDEAVKCALVSMDSSIRSNLSVGLPLDLLTYERDSLRVAHYCILGEDNAYFAHIRKLWSTRLREAFTELPDPDWSNMDQTAEALRESDNRSRTRSERRET